MVNERIGAMGLKPRGAFISYCAACGGLTSHIDCGQVLEIGASLRRSYSLKSRFFSDLSQRHVVQGA